ncbi:MAG: hypothetical protein MI974_13955 [Chitinophagales bacterium]|nr:hypothetical protein [Chitinophagales bacterium]
MANKKPKVVKVTMVSDPDPNAIVSVYFEANSIEDQSTLEKQIYRLAFNPQNPYHYPPHEIMIEGEFEENPIGVHVQNPNGGATEVVQCLVLVFRKSYTGLLPYHFPFSGDQVAALIYSTTRTNPADNDPILSYEALYPAASTEDYAEFQYAEV